MDHAFPVQRDDGPCFDGHGSILVFVAISDMTKDDEQMASMGFQDDSWQ
jgi:hypothetical protein